MGTPDSTFCSAVGAMLSLKLPDADKELVVPCGGRIAAVENLRKDHELRSSHERERIHLSDQHSGSEGFSTCRSVQGVYLTDE
jgi:hypothetical protein